MQRRHQIWDQIYDHIQMVVVEYLHDRAGELSQGVVHGPER